MTLSIEPGTYVVAVSGGVDSMALLDMLQRLDGMKLTVAHFDHGIRDDSHEDRMLVERAAKDYGLPFVYTEGRLGAKASEELARRARYDFLHKVRQASGAGAVVTAHHKDDVLETAIINLLRGTGRKGLTSLRSIDGIKRPLLGHSKQEITRYAKRQNLGWRDDPTNSDPKYLRNHVRHNIIARLGDADREKLHDIITRQHMVNDEIDILLYAHLRQYTNKTELHRTWFIGLEHAVALEVMAAWLRANNIRDFDKNTLERLTHAAKILKVGRMVPVRDDLVMKLEARWLALARTER